MALRTEGTLLADRYRVLRPLGSGGMASVFHCRDERLGREVAVKRLHAESPEDVARRFAREARLGASLNHPNLVSVFDTVTDDEGVLIVMEYVQGKTLRELGQEGPLESARAVEIVGAVAGALDHAHEHGVVHRDVKPANILVRDDGTVKVVDLGIATAADQTKITRSGVVLGTPAYMAPEQLEGVEAGPRADVYALACVAYELMSGEKARRGGSALEIAHDIASNPEPDLRDVRPEAPPALAEELKRGMARDPGQRPASPGELAARLEQALQAPEPAAAAARPTAPTRPAPRRPELVRPRPAAPARRPSPALALALALVALAAAALTAGSLLSGGGDEGERRAERAPAGQGGSARPAPAEEPPAGEEQQDGAQPAPQGGDPAEGRRLNAQGYRLMQAGRYDEAIPVLQRAVRSFPAGTNDVTYAYALYNLGRSLRLGGRPDEAIPILERRLKIPNQTATVKRELEAARRAAD